MANCELVYDSISIVGDWNFVLQSGRHDYRVNGIVVETRFFSWLVLHFREYYVESFYANEEYIFDDYSQFD